MHHQHRFDPARLPLKLGHHGIGDIDFQGGQG
jgi:hypothetical protein